MIEIRVEGIPRTMTARHVELSEYPTVKAYTWIAFSECRCGERNCPKRMGRALEPGANITMAAPGVLVFGSEEHREKHCEGLLVSIFGNITDVLTDPDVRLAD